jgi:hypothetical protein
MMMMRCWFCVSTQGLFLSRVSEFVVPLCLGAEMIPKSDANADIKKQAPKQ